MNKKYLGLIIGIALFTLSASAAPFQIKGFVKDLATESPLSNAIVRMIGAQLIDTTDTNGAFKFLAPTLALQSNNILRNGFTPYFASNKGIVFPNESKGKIQIDIFNLTGKIVSRLFNSELDRGIWAIYPKNLSRGIYLCKISSEKKAHHLKFILSEGNYLKKKGCTLVKSENYFGPGVSALGKRSAPSYDTLEVFRPGYHSEKVAWLKKVNDSLTIYLLDTSAGDGVKTGQWKFLVPYGNMIAFVNSDGKTIDSIVYSYYHPCITNPPTLIKKYGSASIPSSGVVAYADSLTLFFEDSVGAGIVRTPDSTQKCSEKWICDSSACSYSIQCDASHTHCDTSSTGYKYLPKIDTILKFKGLTGSETALSNLTISSGGSSRSLTPAFEPSCLNYACSLAAGSLSVSVTAFVKDANATIKVNGALRKSGWSTSISLHGADTIKIEVISISGLQHQIYSIAVIIPPQWYKLVEFHGIFSEIAVSNTQHSIVWAVINTSGGTTGYYLFKSINYGAAWSKKLDAWNCHGIAVHPLDSNVVYCSTNHIFKTTNGGTAWDTVDKSWNDRLRDAALAIDPNNPQIVYAVSGYIYDDNQKTNNGGQTWSSMGLNYRCTRLSIHPIHSGVLLALANTSHTSSDGIFKSSDSSKTWQKVLEDSMVVCIAIDPVDTNKFYAGTKAGGVMRSIDGGQTWTAANSGLTKLKMKALVIDPVAPHAIYAGIDSGGVYKSVDNGDTWTTMNTSGLYNLNVMSLCVDPTKPDAIYAGTDDGIYVWR